MKTAIRLLGLLIVFSPTAAPQCQTLDLLPEWRFASDPEGAGEKVGWADPNFDDSDWAIIDAGTRWEDQGFPEVDGTAWYRKRVAIPAEWEGQAVWWVLGGANDSYVLYCNGKKVASYGDRPDPESEAPMTVTEEKSVANITTLANLSPYLKFGEENLIALSFADWGGSGGPWHEPVYLTVDRAGLPHIPPAYAFYSGKTDTWMVEVDPTGLGNWSEPEDFRIAFIGGNRSLHPTSVEQTGTGEIVARFQDLNPESSYEEVSISPKSVSTPDKVPFPAYSIPLPTGIDLEWEGYEDLEVLNNFVTVLANKDCKGKSEYTIEFQNPRKGWVFVAASSSDGTLSSESVRARIGEDTDELIWRVNLDNGDLECMRRLSEGSHTLQISTDQPITVSVRKIPELAYSYYPCQPHIQAHGDFDWEDLAKDVLPHVNALITHGDFPEEIRDQWVAEGRSWIGNASLPGLSGDLPPAEEIADYWESNIGLQSPFYRGLIVDEFIGATPRHYGVWHEAVKLLRERGALEGKTFYAWSGDLYQQGDEETHAFVSDLLEHGDLFAVEKYLPEPPDEEAAYRSLYRSLYRSYQDWEKAYPGFDKHLVLCLGYLSAPPESLNTNPSTDYRVFVDQQFHHLATVPEYFGVEGLMEYTTSYADEEIVRLAHRLFRHYCIEGHRSRFLEDPYELTHLSNPDFQEGLEGWTVESATPESIGTGSHEGFSWLQGRYPETKRGITFALMRRSAKSPNLLTQTLRGLKPGRLYSLKIFAADLENWDQNQTIGLSIRLKGGEWIKEHCFREAYPSNYAHEYGPYNRNHPAYFTYHRYVFRADSETADLTLADWEEEGVPSGPIGQRIAFNFVEVQPFLGD
jgi:hypothetical protein